MKDSEKEIVVATIANQMFQNLTLQQALEIVQGACGQAGQAEYEKMPDDKKKEILEQGGQWLKQIQEQFKDQNSKKDVDK